MRSVLAVLIFLLATGLVMFSQARAEVSCGSCGGRDPGEKVCGILRKDMKYVLSGGDQGASSAVELCLDLETGGVSCGVSSDPLLQSSLTTMLSLGVKEMCFKFDTSESPRRVISAQSKIF